MLNVGDTVKVIAKTKGSDGDMREYFPIGSIGKISEVCTEDNGNTYYGVEENGDTFYYFENELEKGHMEWVKE